MKRLLFCMFALVGCDEVLPDGAPDRRALLVTLADTVILPTNAELVTQAETLQVATQNLCDSPDAATLALARNAWRSTRAVYKRSEAYQIGPIDELRKDRDIDFWPIRKNDIEDVLSDTSALDDAGVSALGSSKKGLPVLEYLLFPEDVSDEELLVSLADASRRCTYIAGLGRALVSDTAIVRDAWDPAHGNFRASFTLENDDVYENAQDALDALVNELIFLAEMMEGTKLAVPLGKRNDGVAQPRAVESYFSQNSLTDLNNNLAGLSRVYLADDAPSSLASLLHTLNPELDAGVRAQLLAVQNTLTNIPPPLNEAVVTSPATVEPAFASTKSLLRLLAADVAGQLGVTTTFNDNDGD